MCVCVCLCVCGRFTCGHISAWFCSLKTDIKTYQNNSYLNSTTSICLPLTSWVPHYERLNYFPKPQYFALMTKAKSARRHLACVIFEKNSYLIHPLKARINKCYLLANNTHKSSSIHTLHSFSICHEKFFCKFSLRRTDLVCLEVEALSVTQSS